MTPVYPYLVRRSADGRCGELLLRLKINRGAIIIKVSLEQARALAIEMRGLATDHCPDHHLTRLVAEALDAKVSQVIIKLLEPTGGVMESCA